jgi:hypothetical protein
VGIAEVISALKLVLDVITTGRGVFRESRGKGPLNPKVLAATHELLAYLRADVRNIRMMLAAEDLDRLRDCWFDFFWHLRGLCDWVERIDVALLSIYDPESARRLESIFSMDESLLQYFEDPSKYDAAVSELYSAGLSGGPSDDLRQESRSVSPGPQRKNLRKVRKLHDRLKVLGESTDWGLADDIFWWEERGWFTLYGSVPFYEGAPPEVKQRAEHLIPQGPIAYADEANLETQLGMLEELLEQCSVALASFVRTNWDPKDLSS